MGTSSSKLKRSKPEDVQGNLVWCVNELSKWEDQAAVVKELLATSVSEPSAALHAVAASTAADASAAIAAGTSKEAPPSAEESGAMAESSGGRMDPSASKQVLYAVDEILRHGDAETFFKGISYEKLEEMINAPNSWFVLPPRSDRSSGGMSSTRMFALASLVQVQQHAAKLTAHQSFWSKISSAFKHQQHKRTQSELYESTQTPFNSPEKGGAMRGVGAGAGGATEQVTPITQAERKIESPTIEERSPSPPRTTEATGSEATAAPAGLSLAPSRAASSIEAESKVTEQQLPSLSTVEEQRKFVVAKYLFIHHWYRVMLASAEYSCKATARSTQLRKLSRGGSKSWTEMSPLAKVKYEKVYTEAVESRDRALVYFDRARLVLGWLLRNYELTLAAFKVDTTLKELVQMRDELKAEQPADIGKASAVSRMAHLQQSELMVQWFTRRKLQLMVEQQCNERDGLNIGAHMLDTNLTGTLTSNELADLPVKIFNLLDVRRKGEITTNDIQQCLSNLTSKLDLLESRLHQMSSENLRLQMSPSEMDAATIEKNKHEANRIRADMAEMEASLSSIWSVFHRSLVHHVFAKAVPELDRVSADSVSMHQLDLSLDEIEHQSHINPLEEEMNLGLWVDRSIGRGGEKGKEKEKEKGGATRGLFSRGQQQKSSSAGARASSTEKASTRAEPKESVLLQRSSPPPPKLSSAEEQKIPSKDESALLGVGLPVHKESGGVPVLSTTASEDAGVGEKIKSALTGGGGGEKTETQTTTTAAKESAAESKLPQTSGTSESETGATAGSESSLMSKIKNAVSMGQ